MGNKKTFVYIIEPVILCFPGTVNRGRQYGKQRGGNSNNSWLLTIAAMIATEGMKRRMDFQMPGVCQCLPSQNGPLILIPLITFWAFVIYSSERTLVKGGGKITWG